MFYGVYFTYRGNYDNNTFLAGYYENLSCAKIRLDQIIPNYGKYINNCVKNDTTNIIGWINQYEFGDFNFDTLKGLSASQPHSSINLFDNL